MAFDWEAFETDLSLAAAKAVREMVEAAASETPYAVAFSEFYAETTGVIYLPNLALATEESVDDPDCRFSPPDWEYQDYEWGETDSQWGERLSAAVTDLPRTQWEQEWDRFAQAMLNIAARTRTTLVAAGTLPDDAVVYLDDEDADLLVRSLTAEELRRHFPDYLAAAEAERNLLAMPIEQRVASLVAAAGFLPGPPGALGRERATELLLDAGAAAVPAGITALGHPETAWAGAKLLADLNIATPEVLEALWAALPLRGNAHDWVATALGRLGAGLEVLARRDLPAGSRAAAVAAPYRSFRDHGRGHPPLDYTLLAAGLADPAVATIVADDLKPGRGYCTLDAADLPGVRPGLEHPEPVIRRHAVIVLSDLIGPMGSGDLDRDVVSALEDRIDQLAAEDPDSEVRRLAGYRARR
ncbi:DUF4303 domain-containing protein [Mycolicibacterium boenickei]|uniref:DUF4303 domain-containing protein n=1 Tax=Mycolicibacterium boenickei TaxID=146017 RepID=A0AAX2ZQC0_9MYCO|nr:DUF4303 domain-containing protein [Mycolicibacterium boenickei]PEG57009.1 hypothetical protein CQY21_29545 [Mycolicibacterium boenickei]UNB97544.1 DUF4303 domain-containing protein [Mycolicibacterium boenickei]BBX93254.1 hypothetical protein MBOE_49030 [Mycolicibacterium boenickei]